MPARGSNLLRLTATPTLVSRWAPESGSDTRFLLTVAAILAVFYLPTASYGLNHPDPLTNMFTAWSVANQQTVYLDDWASVTGPPFYGHANQIITGKGGPVSKYPPGAALLAAPLHFGWDPAPTTEAAFITLEGTERASFRLPSFIPAAVVASLTTALGVAAMSVLVRRRLGHVPALSFAVVLGLGTGYWSVAADGLWQHGPLAMWTGLGLLALDRHRPLLAGAAFAAAVLTRPQIAIAIALIGITIAWSRRSWQTLLGVGVVSGLGMVVYVIFNLAVFGHPIPYDAGGYFVANTVTASWSFFLDNILQTLFNPRRSLLLFSPITLVALPGLSRAWHRADAMVRSPAIGGLVLMLVQLRGNVWDGGDAFFGYRYALELVLLTSPLAALSIHQWVQGSVVRTRITSSAASLSVLIHAIGSVLY